MRVLYPFIALFIATSVYSQNSGFGVKAGANYSYLASEAAAEKEFMFGANGGLYFPILVRERLEIQPEIIYSMQGGGMKFPSSTTQVRLSYITIPVTAKVYFNNWLNIQFGPQFGYMISANSRFNDEEATNASEDYHTHDISVSAGIGFANQQGIDVDLRYIMGLTSLLREDEILFPRNRVVQLSIGYRFGQVRRRR